MSSVPDQSLSGAYLHRISNLLFKEIYGLMPAGPEKEILMHQLFRIVFYPYFPSVTLIIAIISLIVITILNTVSPFLYFGILLVSYIWFHFFVKQSTYAS